MNQTRYGVSHGCLETKAERISGIACLGKKLVFHMEMCIYFEEIILKIGHFHRVKELSKVNQTRYGVSHWCLESTTVRIFVIACLEKMFVFQSEISIFSLFIRSFYFQKYRTFVGLRS